MDRSAAWDARYRKVGGSLSAGAGDPANPILRGARPGTKPPLLAADGDAAAVAGTAQLTLPDAEVAGVVTGKALGGAGLRARALGKCGVTEPEQRENDGDASRHGFHGDSLAEHR